MNQGFLIWPNALPGTKTTDKQFAIDRKPENIIPMNPSWGNCKRVHLAIVM